MKFLVLLLILNFHLSWAVPLGNRPSLDQVKELAMYNVRRIPELSKLWMWLDHEGRSDIYWTGSSARGFIRWHYKQLETHSIEDLKQMPPPPLKKFLPVAGYDIDLVGPVADSDKILSLLPDGFEIDIIGEETYQKLVELGGPTIGKIIINPFRIQDPLKGLDHYHQGTLVYKSVPEKIFRNLPIIQTDDYSKTEMALRFIRLSYDLPELHVDPASVELIRQIASAEKNWKWTSKRKNHVAIVLEKILIANNGDIVDFIKILARYNLLPTLATARIGIPAAHGETMSTFIRDGRLQMDDFSLENLRHAEEMVGSRNQKSHYEFLKLVTPRIKNFNDLLIVSRMEKESSINFSQASNIWLSKNIDLISSLNPSAEEIFQLYSQAKVTALNQARISRQLKVPLPLTKKYVSLLMASLRTGPNALKLAYSSLKKRYHYETSDSDEHTQCLTFYKNR